MFIPVNIPDTDCDTCGRSWNSLEVCLGDDGQWCADLTIGCYGGASYEGDRAGLIAFLRQDCSRAVNADDLERAIRALEAA